MLWHFNALSLCLDIMWISAILFHLHTWLLIDSFNFWQMTVCSIDLKCDHQHIGVNTRGHLQDNPGVPLTYFVTLARMNIHEMKKSLPFIDQMYWSRIFNFARINIVDGWVGWLNKSVTMTKIVAVITDARWYIMGRNTLSWKLTKKKA